MDAPKVGDRLTVTRHDDSPQDVGTVRLVTNVSGSTITYRQIGGLPGTTGSMQWPDILGVASFTTYVPLADPAGLDWDH